MILGGPITPVGKENGFAAAPIHRCVQGFAVVSVAQSRDAIRGRFQARFYQTIRGFPLTRRHSTAYLPGRRP